jgi:hypothetical protein
MNPQGGPDNEVAIVFDHFISLEKGLVLGHGIVRLGSLLNSTDLRV